MFNRDEWLNFQEVCDFLGVYQQFEYVGKIESVGDFLSCMTTDKLEFPDSVDFGSGRLWNKWQVIDYAEEILKEKYLTYKEICEFIGIKYSFQDEAKQGEANNMLHKLFGSDFPDFAIYMNKTKFWNLKQIEDFFLDLKLEEIIMDKNYLLDKKGE